MSREWYSGYLWTDAQVAENADLFGPDAHLSAKRIDDGWYWVADRDLFRFGPPKTERPFFLGTITDRSVGRFVWEIVSPTLFVPSRGSGLPPIHVRAHTLTDYASAPRITWPIIPLRDGVYDPAAAVHDVAARNRRLLGISLSQCHQIFAEALAAKRVPRVRAAIMYSMVYMFNWLFAGPGDGTTPPRLIRRVREQQERTP